MEAGHIGSLEVRVGGQSTVRIASAQIVPEVRISGAGKITVLKVEGDVKARVSGAGNIRITHRPSNVQRNQPDVWNW